MTQGDQKVDQPGTNGWRRPQTVTLPKGGGAILGVGEKSVANPIVGAGTMSEPVATTPRRSAFGPLAIDLPGSRGTYGATSRAGWRLQVCLLGPFMLLGPSGPVRVRSGQRAQALLQALALRYERPVSREAILAEVWPDGDPRLSGPSLNSLVYDLHKHLGANLDGAAPVVSVQGAYCLNFEAGVTVDTACYFALVAEGDRRAADDPRAAALTYRQAVDLYRGDLCTHFGDLALIEGERLRASYLTLLSRLAAYAYQAADYDGCLSFGFKLLAHDACREDAHRMVMLCHLARGERTAALRQYRFCESILRSEFDVQPERATVDLFDQIRHDPATI